MVGALSLLGLLALASPSGSSGFLDAINAEPLTAFPQPTLVADILPGPAGSNPRWFRPVPGGAIFFTGTPDPSSPDQGTLWRTDGTPAGTFSIQPQGIQIVNVLSTPGPYQWLQARDANSVESLWRTDGTVPGTIKILDRSTFDSHFWYQRKTGRLYFRTLPDPLRNLWVSDGTPEGTRQLMSFDDPLLGASERQGVPGSKDSFFFSVFAEMGDKVFFIGPGGPQGTPSLWRTDGTQEGTRVVASPPVDFEFKAVWQVGSTLYLWASGEEGDPSRLWKSDGTTAGTVEIDSFGSERATSFGLFGDVGDGRSVWLVHKNFEAMPSLWVTDGRKGGAIRLLGLANEPGSRPLLLNGLLYFVANDGGSGNELWRTNGTPAGTRLAFDRCPGACSGLYTGVGPTLAANRILIFSNDPDVGIEPLVTDGTLAGTHLLGDLCPGSCGGAFLGEELLGFGGTFFFLAHHLPETFPQIWSTDLTPSGTVRRTDFPGGVYQMIQLGDRLLFTTDNGAIGPELWSLAVPRLDPSPPAGPWLSSRTLSGFEVKVRIANPSGGISGVLEPDCIPETICVSGALRGRSEVFIRVVGPKPNGRLWPTLVKFTTSAVEIWIRQTSSGAIRYYPLEGARPGFDELPGLFDREGFTP